ncbi:MAG: M48 family metallopeptidase [Epsilonproteobacteria bacterium]|nr:M48 family metallopeptidase [Campylobacterota bacterium]
MQTVEEIAYTISRKFGLKHTYIYIEKDGSVVVKANYFVTKKTIHDFILKKHTWILKKQHLLKERQRDLNSDTLYYLGEKYTKKEFYNRYHLTESDAEVDRFYKIKAKEIIEPLVVKWSKTMMLTPTHIGFRKNRTRWGSCSAKNRLSFNTKLAQMHPDFIEYVVVHELAHIKHKNHSKAFWDCVATVLPDYKARQNLAKI